MKRGGQKHPDTTSTPRKENGGMRRVTDGEGGKGEEVHRGEGRFGGLLGLTPTAGGPWPAPLSLGPAAEIPALCAAQLARRQSCASSGLGIGKWGTRQAYGQEARSAEQRAGRLLGPGTQTLPGPAQACPLNGTEATAPGLHKYPGSACR